MEYPQLEELYNIFLKHNSVQTDTRKLKTGEIYFALKGPNFNGNDFALDAIKNGAALAVVDDVKLEGKDKCLLVEDVLTMLQQLARHHRRQMIIPVLAITGSNGKTTTKELLNSILSKKFNTLATIGNLNNHIGVPLTLLSLKAEHDFAIIEMGANHVGEIANLCSIAEPNHGVITNCGKAHLEGFGTEAGVRKGKGELYDFLRAAKGKIYRFADATYLEPMAKKIAKQITYGINMMADYNGLVLDSEKQMLSLNITSSKFEFDVDTHLAGQLNIPNVLAAVAIGDSFGIKPDDIKEALENYQPDNNRSQWKKIGTNKLVLDAYNANPTSMEAAISNFAEADLPNKHLWIGAMKEMGAAEKKEHQQLIAFIKQHEWENVLLVGSEYKGLEEGFQQFDTVEDAVKHLKKNLPTNANILVKGSRGSKMELLVAELGGAKKK